MEIGQYQVVMVNLDPTLGREMKKTRHCLVISPDEMNRHLDTIVIAPLTTKSKPYPTRVEVRHNKTTGWVVLEQIRTIDRLRVVSILGSLTEPEIMKVKLVIHQTYVE